MSHRNKNMYDPDPYIQSLQTKTINDIQSERGGKEMGGQSLF